MNIAKLSDQFIVKEITARLKKHRLNLNMTQKALAEKAGVHVQTIKNFESGKSTTLLTFIQILRAFEALDTLDALFPDPGVSPIQLLKLQGKQRKRASGPSVDNSISTSW